MSVIKSVLPCIFLFSSIAIGGPATNLALDQSIANNDLRAVEQHIENGADVNNKDDKRFTPLHYAVCLAEIEIIELLLAFGARANAISNEGVTALSLSVRKNDPSLTLKLLEHLTYKDLPEHAIIAERSAMVYGHFELAALIRGYLIECQIESEVLAWQGLAHSLLPSELVAKISSLLSLRPFRLPHQKDGSFLK